MAVTKTVALVADVQSSTAVSGAQIGIEFFHISGTDPIWISMDETNTPANVTVEADNMLVVLPGMALIMPTSVDSFTVKSLCTQDAKLHISLVNA